MELIAHGCGLTHATVFLVTGRVKEAIEANYTVFGWWLIIILLIINRYVHKLNKAFLGITLGTVTAITIIRYLYKIIK